jgi:Trypsin-like peptidase domain
MRRIICLVSFFAAFYPAPNARCVTAQQSQQSVGQVVKDALDAVVLIVVNDGDGKPTAQGSGFIVSADGRVVTNHHVIDGAQSAIVKLNNGAFFIVEGVIADDPEHDIVVLKVSGKNLPSLRLADSEALLVGDHVVAIGSPLGLENSVSDGIISGFRSDSKGQSWVQTTAPVSHGNSGGPLLTMDERVVGVITWKVAAGENLNFAVPSKVIAALLTSTAVRPLGSQPKSDSTSSPVSGERLWTSMTTGRDYKVRIDGEYIYTQWINLPAALQSTTAFMRAELRKSGDKWVGKTVAYIPVNQKWCHIETDMEIDKISDSRIEGKSVFWQSINARNCSIVKPELRPFVFIPK